MGLAQLIVSNFRNLASVSLQPLLRGFNIVYGNNGSGKTSLLESIYYLSLGRSFRNTTIERVIRHSEQAFSLFAHVTLNHGHAIPVGLERRIAKPLVLRVNGQDVSSISELAALLPVQLMDSHCHDLLDGGPSFRRKYLDWGLFYSNKQFLRAWQEFDRALKQRNASLRINQSKKERDAWLEPLIANALLLDQMRGAYVEQLMPLLESMIAELLPIASLSVAYQSGWDRSRAYADVLQQAENKDIQLGYTQYGPHKADLKIQINGVPAKDILSRGQQKLFVCAMIVTRGFLLQSVLNKRSIYLLDDLPSELDSASRTRLLGLLSRQDSQIFVTGIEFADAEASLTGSAVKMFHVEHGSFKEV